VDLAGAGLGEAGEQVEQRGLAGPVGADQGVDVPLLHGQIHVVDGGEALEAFAQPPGAQYLVRHVCPLP